MSTHRPKTKSPIVKRSISIKGHKTSVSLEEPFWQYLNAIAGRRGLQISELIASLDSKRTTQNLSSTLRTTAFLDVLAQVPTQPSVQQSASQPALHQ